MIDSVTNHPSRPSARVSPGARRRQPMKHLIFAFTLLFLPFACFAQGWPTTPQPQSKPSPVTPRSNDYAAGFSFDNQLYALQGGGIAMIVGTMTYRPWAGLAAGVGSCALYRAIHNPQHFFASNRMEFCAAGSLVSYGVMKLMHVRRPH